MSTEQDKFKHSKRIHNDESVIKKQVKIAKEHGCVTPEHAYAKRHAMTCGDSNCAMCGNPRKFFSELTIQEKRSYQDIDRHNNGLSNEDI
jgi:hypothetical protein